MLVHSDISSTELEASDLWEYAQHYDLPTPLIDWSFSPYVGLFFALNDFQIKPNEEDERCIWVLNLTVLEMLNEMVEGEIRSNAAAKIEAVDSELLEFAYPVMRPSGNIDSKNKRLYFQQGFFTQPGEFASIEIWLEAVFSEFITPYIDKPLLTKLVFRCTEQSRIRLLENLDKMNINYRTLFPDGYGAAKDSVEKTYREFMKPVMNTLSMSILKND